MGDHERHEQFCEGVAIDKCGCLQTDAVKRNALHVKRIIEVCETLPLDHIDIGNFLHSIGLEIWNDSSTQVWSFRGDLYGFYKEYIQRPESDNLFPAFNLCMEFWSYTNPDVPHDTVAAQLATKYEQYRAQFTTIQSELTLFMDTYPLQRHRAAPEPNPHTKLQIRHLLRQLNV